VASKPEGSSQFSQEPAIGPYPEPPESTLPPRLISLRSSLILTSHLCVGLPSGLFPLGFPTNTLYTSLFFPMRVTCLAHLIFIDLICPMLFGDVYKLWSSSLCNVMHSPVTQSSLVQILSLEPCSQTPSVYVLPLMWGATFHTHTRQLAELWFCIF
jgi:hypothetical protein